MPRSETKFLLRGQKSLHQNKFGAGQAKIKIIVQDTGVGIPEEELESLFTKTFERGEEAKKLWGPGKGIGLFLTYQIIRAHQGKLWAESQGRNKGSTFYVELPMV